MTEFFKQLVGLAGYGLVGLAIVMIIVLAYVMKKMPKNKFAIGILVGFCMFVLGLFTYAGVGIAKENKQIETRNEELKDSTQQLSSNNTQLKDSIKIVGTKLDIAGLQYTLVKQDVSKDSLSRIINMLTRDLDTLSLRDKSPQKTEWSRMALDYKRISERLNANEVNTKEAKEVILQNNNRLPIYEKHQRVSR